MPLLHPAHRSEIKAFAQAADLNPDSALLANAFIDMGLYAGSCRSLVVDARDGFSAERRIPHSLSYYPVFSARGQGGSL